MVGIMLYMILMMVVTTYWLSSSLIIQLLTMALYVIVNSILVFSMGDAYMIPYLMLFSVISGLVAVLSFVMMSEPNSESSVIGSKYMYALLGPMVMIITILTPMEVYNSQSNLLVNYLTGFSSFSTDQYLQVFVFMALVLLMMLFVVDLILISHGGSMLPMK